MLRGHWADWRALSGTARVDRLLWGAVALAALLAIAAFGYAAALRLPYPFELEWMEGGVLDHVRTVLRGEPLYRRPSLEFTPYLYTPLYYYACALIAAVTGPSFAVARLVSIAGVVACLYVVHAFVRRETDDPVAAMTAAGLLAGAYQLAAYWFDLVRPDSLAVGLLFGGAYVARFGRRRRHAVGAALLLAAAVLTKQTMLAPALAALAAMAVASRRRALAAGATFVVALTGVAGALEISSQGWFSYYAVFMPGQHRWMWDSWRDLLQGYLWNRWGVAVLFALLALIASPLRARCRAAWSFHASFLVLAVGSGYAGALHQDGFVNAFLPAYGAIAMVAGHGVAWARRATQGRPTSAGLRACAAIALLAQFALLAYWPPDAVPTRGDVRAGREMIAQLRRAPRDMLMLGTGFYGYLAGHPEIQAHSMALADVFKTSDVATKKALEQDLLQGIRSHRFASVVVGRGVTHILPASIVQAMRRHYRLERRLFDAEHRHRCRPRSGFDARPEELWLTREPRGRQPPLSR